ncbi:MAG: esterase/lipase family protein, partial [Pleurocapsa sp.]
KLTANCDSDVCENKSVVVLHGLVRSSASMSKISQALNTDGYTVCNIQYLSRKHSIEKLAVNFVYPEIKKCLPGLTGEINFVTHSMGGIIVRQLARSTDIKPYRVVMLSPPNQGSELVDKLKVIPLFKLINGEAGLSLGTEEDSIPNSLGSVDFETGIITGDRSYNPFYSYLIPGADDGKVGVNRAKVSGMKDFLVVPYSHSFIMNKDIVIKQTINFIQSGGFKMLKT